MKNLGRIILLIFVMSSFSVFSQTTEDCPTCEKEQAIFDSINVIYKKYHIQIDQAKQVVKNAEQNQKNLELAVQALEKTQVDFIPIKSQFKSARQQLEQCFSAGNLSECKKCKDGHEVNDDGALCDDGDPCTINDRCVNGVCIGDPVTSNENPDCGGGKGN